MNPAELGERVEQHKLTRLVLIGIVVGHRIPSYVKSKNNIKVMRAEWRTVLHTPESRAAQGVRRYAEFGSELVRRLPRCDDTRNRLQIGDNADIIPTVQKEPCFGCNRSADFHDQPATGTQGG